MLAHVAGQSLSWSTSMIYFYLVDRLSLLCLKEGSQDVEMGNASGLAGGCLGVIGVTLTHTSAQLNPVAKRPR